MDKKTMGWTAIVVAILIALTQYMGWSGDLHYLWAVLVLVWGVMAMKHKGKK